MARAPSWSLWCCRRPADHGREVFAHLAHAGGQLVDGLVALEAHFPGEIALGYGANDIEEMIELLPQGLAGLPFGGDALPLAGGLFVLLPPLGFQLFALLLGLFAVALPLFVGFALFQSGAWACDSFSRGAVLEICIACATAATVAFTAVAMTLISSCE